MKFQFHQFDMYLFVYMCMAYSALCNFKDSSIFHVPLGGHWKSPELKEDGVK